MSDEMNELLRDSLDEGPADTVAGGLLGRSISPSIADTTEPQ